MIRVYVAGPYTGGNTNENVAHAVHFGFGLRAMDDRICPFVPHLYHFAELLAGAQEYDWWMQICLEEVRRSDYLIRLDGESNGADMEMEEALVNGIPVLEGPKSPQEALRWLMEKAG